MFTAKPAVKIISQAGVFSGNIAYRSLIALLLKFLSFSSPT